MAKEKQKNPRTFRIRDLMAGAAVLILAAALLYTALNPNPSSTGELSFAAFFLAVTLLALGYGGGMLLDRLLARAPTLSKNRFSSVVFLLLPPLVIVLGVLVWTKRESLSRFADEKANQAIVSVESFIHGGNLLQ